MTKLETETLKRRIANTFSDKELYELLDDLSFRYEQDLIASDLFTKVRKDMQTRISILSKLRKQVNRVFSVANS